MMKKKVFFSISLIVAVGFCMTASAQNDSTKQTRWQRINQKLKENYAKVNYDTEYIGRPDLLWTVKLKGNIGGSQFNNYGKYAGESMRGKLKSDDMRTIGVEVGYSGLSLGFSINPTSNSKKYKDEEVTMNYYDNHFGFDVEYQHIKSFHGYQNSWGERWPVEKGDMKMNNLRINGYYVFNGKKFSYPAAFNYTYLQKRSAGSWLAGATFQNTKLRTTPDTDDPDPYNARLHSTFVAIGGGYAYNWVFHRNWLLHVSALPSLIVYARHSTRVSYEGENYQEKSHAHFPDAMTTERVALVRNWSKFYGGASFVMTNTLTGDKNGSITYSHWNAQIVLGMRF